MGTDFIADAYAEGSRWHEPYELERVRARIVKEIGQARWYEPRGMMPMSPALMLQAIAEELGSAGIEAVSYDRFITLPDGPERGTYSLLGVRKRYRDSKAGGTWLAHHWCLDTGVAAVPILLDTEPPAVTILKHRQGEPDGPVSIGS